MKNNYGRKVVVLAIALAVAGVSAEAQDQQPTSRGFLFEAGIGAASIYYGPAAEAMFASATSSGLDRLEIALDLEAGWAITQDLYLAAVAHGTGTRFYDSYGDYLQINSYLFGAGLRAYPFHTGLVLGADAGVAKMVIDSNVGLYAVSPAGWAAAVSVAWDFNKRPTGFGIIAGIRVVYTSIGTASTAAGTAFVDIAWK